MINYEILLSIVGGFGTMALTINAYFLRGIFQDLNSVKIELAKMGEQAYSKEKRIDELESDKKELFQRLHRLEKQL